MTRLRPKASAAPESDVPVSDAVDRLTENVKIVWQTLDEIRDALQWALRNAQDLPGLTPPIRVTSMALDPCDPEWRKKLNALRPEDLPAEERKPVRDASIIVDAQQFEHALADLQRRGVVEVDGNRVRLKAGDLAEAMEGVDQLIYCCTEPQLEWEGDPDAPSVLCRKCGYVVAEYGNVVDQRDECKEGADEEPPVEPPPRRGTQGRLWANESEPDQDADK